MKKIILTCSVLALLCSSHSLIASNFCDRSASVITMYGSSDWDKLLDEYEKYVDLYISTYKKAMNGDLSAMTEYVKLMKSAQKLSDKLDKAKDDMSSEQLQRYMKILKKMTNAIESM